MKLHDDAERLEPLTVRDQITMSWRDLLRAVPKRALALIGKLVGVRGVALVLTTWLLVRGALESWHYLLFLTAVVFGPKVLDRLRAK